MSLIVILSFIMQSGNYSDFWMRCVYYVMVNMYLSIPIHNVLGDVESQQNYLTSDDHKIFLHEFIILLTNFLMLKSPVSCNKPHFVIIDCF